MGEGALGESGIVGPLGGGEHRLDALLAAGGLDVLEEQVAVLLLVEGQGHGLTRPGGEVSLPL